MCAKLILAKQGVVGKIIPKGDGHADRGVRHRPPRLSGGIGHRPKLTSRRLRRAESVADTSKRWPRGFGISLQAPPNRSLRDVDSAEGLSRPFPTQPDPRDGDAESRPGPRPKAKNETLRIQKRGHGAPKERMQSWIQNMIRFCFLGFTF